MPRVIFSPKRGRAEVFFFSRSYVDPFLAVKLLNIFFVGFGDVFLPFSASFFYRRHYARVENNVPIEYTASKSKA